MILRQIYFFILSLFKSKWRLEYDGEFGYELIKCCLSPLVASEKYIQTVPQKIQRCFISFQMITKKIF